MQKFDKLEGVAAPMDIINIDTKEDKVNFPFSTKSMDVYSPCEQSISGDNVRGFRIYLKKPGCHKSDRV